MFLLTHSLKLNVIFLVSNDGNKTDVPFILEDKVLL